MNDRPRGLGRGLSALLGEPLANAFGAQPQGRSTAPEPEAKSAAAAAPSVRQPIPATAAPPHAASGRDARAFDPAPTGAAKPLSGAAQTSADSHTGLAGLARAGSGNPAGAQMPSSGMPSSGMPGSGLSSSGGAASGGRPIGAQTAPQSGVAAETASRGGYDAGRVTPFPGPQAAGVGRSAAEATPIGVGRASGEPAQPGRQPGRAPSNFSPNASPGASMSSAAAPTDFEAPTPAPVLVPIELIQRNPNQPRRHFDETELGELCSSIRTHGVLQAILLRPAPRAEGRFEIVAGERRWRAAQMAGLHEIPAVILELNDVQILEIAIIENVQRADLNPIEEATGYQQLVDRFGRTQQDIAEIVGKSRPHIANMLRLLTLPDEIQDMVRDGRLSAGHARAILTAPNPLELAQMAISQAMNVRELERLASRVREEKDGPRARGVGPTKDADTRALESQLTNALGLGVSINHRGEAGGQITVSYRTLEQLDEICRRLSNG